MDRPPSHANPYQRYALAGPAFLVDPAEERYVRIAPAGDGYVVDHGALGAAGTMLASAPGERFGTGALGEAVQRVCALVAEWLGFDEWEVEQVRELFLAPAGDG